MTKFQIESAGATERTSIVTATTSSIDDFSIITGSEHHILTEIEYEQIVTIIKDFKSQVLLVQKSNSKKFQIIEKIEKWRDDPINKFAVPWMEHFEVLYHLFQERGNQIYIANSILKEYLDFIFEKILTPSKGKVRHQEILDKFVSLFSLMIRNTSNIIFIDLILRQVHKDFSDHQVMSLFSNFHQLLPHYANHLQSIEAKEQQNSFSKILKVYLTYFNYFHHRKSRNIYAIRRCFHVPGIFVAFFELIPIYHAFISETTKVLNYLGSISNLESLEIIGIINFFLEQTKFNNVFGSSVPAVLNKINIFAIIKDIIFSQYALLDILTYCLDYSLMYVFEFILIFSNENAEFFETCLALIERFMTNKKYDIDVYAAVLAVCPRITLEDLDKILMKLLDANPDRKDLDITNIRGFRKIIAAVDNIPNSPIWQMSDTLIKMIESDTYDSKDHFFYHAARIYLHRRFGIPFSCTRFTDDTSEEVDWVEVIGFINFFLEREGMKAKMKRSDIPKISTTHK